MQQHPVPQNVTQYQFRLVGDMTLKQFLELLGGIIGAYLFYSSNLIFIFKWPLAILSLLAGFGLAFFPIEDRPLDQWVINFLKSIYAPTRFIWKKSNKIPNIFTFEPHPVIEVQASTKTVKAPSIADLQPARASDISDEERQRIGVLDAMLAKSAPTVPTATQAPKIIEKPTLKPHKLAPVSKLAGATIFQSAPRPTPAPKPITLDGSDVKMPQTSPQSVFSTATKTETQIEKQTEKIIINSPSITANKSVATVTPANINLPAAPSLPNLVVGMVVDKENKIIENAIVQIVTNEGIPARAMKTNSLGQFYTSTPLSPGDYSIEVEKEGLTFPINRLTIQDKQIAPILLRAS